MLKWPGDNERHPAIAFKLIAVAGIYSTVLPDVEEQRNVVYIYIYRGKVGRRGDYLDECPRGG